MGAFLIGGDRSYPYQMVVKWYLLAGGWDGILSSGVKEHLLIRNDEGMSLGIRVEEGFLQRADMVNVFSLMSPIVRGELIVEHLLPSSFYNGKANIANISHLPTFVREEPVIEHFPLLPFVRWS